MAAKDVVFGGEARARMVEGSLRTAKLRRNAPAMDKRILRREPANQISER